MRSIEYLDHKLKNLPARKAALLKIGDQFQIVHSDGFKAFETIATIVSDKAERFYFVCESCAVYTENDLLEAKKGTK